MGKSNKSRRFVQQGKDSIARHAEKIPYHTTLAEEEQRYEEFEQQDLQSMIITESNGGGYL